MASPTRNPSADAAALAQYDDLAADVRRSVDSEFGALTWTTPAQPRHHRDDMTHQCYLLSSTSWGLQLPGAETDRDRIRRLTDAALNRHGFPATHELAGSRAQYSLESIAGDSVRFEAMARSQYAFWIEIPLPDDQCA